MNKKIHITILLLIGLFSNLKISSAQGTVTLLSVTQISGFPVCPDSAFEGQFYTLGIWVKNVGSDTLTSSDTVFVRLMNLDSSVQITQEDIATSNFQMLSPGDSGVINIGYQFDNLRYKSGSNIVVVWPRVANVANSAADSLELLVCYVPIVSVGNEIKDPDDFSVFPNPFSGMVTLMSQKENTAESVRILDGSGRIILQNLPFSGPLDLSKLNSGFYFIEILKSNLVKHRMKIIKL